VFVLLNDQNPNKQPASKGLAKPPSLANIDPSKRVDPLIAAGILPPPTGVAKMAAAPPQQQAKPVARAPPQEVEKTQPKKGLTAYEQLPTPQNPKLVLANDRKIYDNALEEQLKIEQAKLEEMFRTKNISASAIQKQREQVEQLVQQKELVMRQKKQAEDARKQQIKDAQARAAQAKAIDEAKAAPLASPASAPPSNAAAVNQLEGAALEKALREFFLVHEPEAVEDGRLQAVLAWTEDRGVEKLCAMLREQYGKDLYGQASPENTPVDQVQADRYARRLMGFYKAHGVNDMANWDECLKLGEWTCKNGVAALNAKLAAKYGEDLDSYAQQVMLSVEGKLRDFYKRKNPEILDKGLGPLLTWVVSNGVDALNAMLRDKYGEDLNGRKAEIEEKAEFQHGTSARALFHKQLQAAETVAANVEDVVAKRKDMLIKQLASFLQVKDPKRLHSGGLVPLVQWALPRTDRQVDELLMESYGADLEESGLRRFSFDEDEVRSFAGSVDESEAAGRAVRAASQLMEDEFARAEIRSMRATTDERPVSTMTNDFEDVPEPDF